MFRIPRDSTFRPTITSNNPALKRWLKEPAKDTPFHALYEVHVARESGSGGGVGKDGTSWSIGYLGASEKK